MRTLATRKSVELDWSTTDMYPTHDGEPMESSLHLRVMFLLYAALDTFFAEREDVFVAANLFWYWQEGNPSLRRSPDAMIVPGVGKHDRVSFLSWNEGGAVPAVAVELTSRRRWREDSEVKYELYQSLGVAEYFLFDPTGRCPKPRLRGYRLRGKKYVPLRPAADESVGSALGFRLRGDGKWLRVIDAAGNVIPTPTEFESRVNAKLRRAEAERAAAEHRADEAVAELERLREQLRRLSGGQS